VREQIKQLLKNSVYRAIGETANGIGAVNGDGRTLRIDRGQTQRRGVRRHPRIARFSLHNEQESGHGRRQPPARARSR